MKTVQVAFESLWDFSSCSLTLCQGFPVNLVYLRLSVR